AVAVPAVASEAVGVPDPSRARRVARVHPVHRRDWAPSAVGPVVARRRRDGGRHRSHAQRRRRIEVGEIERSRAGDARRGPRPRAPRRVASASAAIHDRVTMAGRGGAWLARAAGS
ncbi:MAG: hypothetical protein M0Z82_18495, partial [Actinomycetota bacterium]|nr:hypothetical protein [Actinomycetota bacterium]